MRRFGSPRREAFTACGTWRAAPRPAQPQELIGEPPGRVPPPSELVNAFEFELMAKRKLGSAISAEIAGCERGPMDRITFNPRMMVNTATLDLTTPLFGDNLFAPILIGPIADQRRYHPDGELAMLRGAAAAKTTFVVAAHSSGPVEDVAARAKTTLGYQVYPGSNACATPPRATQ